MEQNERNKDRKNRNTAQLLTFLQHSPDLSVLLWLSQLQVRPPLPELIFRPSYPEIPLETPDHFRHDLGLSDVRVGVRPIFSIIVGLLHDVDHLQHLPKLHICGLKTSPSGSGRAWIWAFLLLLLVARISTHLL